jgi:hypothetical protein
MMTKPDRSKCSTSRSTTMRAMMRARKKALRLSPAGPRGATQGCVSRGATRREGRSGIGPSRREHGAKGRAGCPAHTPYRSNPWGTASRRRVQLAIEDRLMSADRRSDAAPAKRFLRAPAQAPAEQKKPAFVREQETKVMRGRS